jgi:hypothetical protein
LWVIALLGCLAVAPLGCAGASGGLEAAQRQMPFPIKMPRCVPERAAPTPQVEVLAAIHASDPPAVSITFWYRDQSTAPNPMGSAVSVIEAKEPEGTPVAVTVGEHRVLFGHEVTLSPAGTYPGMEWVDAGVHFSMATSLTWDEALRVYRSLVEPAYRCD